MDPFSNSKNTMPFKGTKLEEATKYSRQRANNRGSGDLRSAISNTEGCAHFVCPVCGEEYPAYMTRVVCCNTVLSGTHLKE